MDNVQKQIVLTQIKQRYDLIKMHLSERVKRIWASSEALVIGRGGNAIVCEATGISRTTINKGKEESRQKKEPVSNRVRQKGGGRKKLGAKIGKIGDR